MNLVILFGIWIVIGLLVAVLAPSIWKRERPFGETADYLVAIVAAVITGLLDWYVVPLLGITGNLLFLAAVIEPALVALIVLWLMRRLKRGQG